MIEGLRVEMRTEELKARLAERIAWHQRAAAGCEAEWRQRDVEREDPLRPEHMLELEMREHREQAGMLEMLRDHLVPGEVYRLGELDLRFADLVPDFHAAYSLPLRRADEAGGTPVLEG